MAQINKTYLLKSKALYIRKAIAHFKEEFNIDIKIFTKKMFYYFTIHNNIKYIHKESFLFYLNNGDTFTYDIIPWKCNIDSLNTFDFMYNDIVKLLKSNNNLIPHIRESNNFYMYDFVEGEPIIDISVKEFFELRKFFNENTIIPFYNSMCFNIVRTLNGLKIIDLKHFERKDNKPFYIYLNNDKYNINTLYIEETSDLELVLKHLRRDYTITNENIKVIKE